MILSRHLQELISFRAPSPAVVSVYLNLEGGKTAAAALAAARKHWVDDSAAIADDMKAIERAAAEHRSAGERAVAFFSSHRFGLLRVCPLPHPMRARLTVDTRADLVPLLNQADQHLRYGVVIVDEKKARFLEYYMGRLRELDDQAIHQDDVSAQPALVRAAAGRAEQLARQLAFQRLIVAAAPIAERKLVDLMHRSLQDSLIVDSTLIGLPAGEVCARIEAAEDQARRVREMVLAHRLVDAGSARSGIGLRATLDAVEQRRVKTLLLRDGFTKLGRRCLSCDRLSINDSKCVMCGGATQTVFNLAEEIAERALRQGGEVILMAHQTPLDNLGSIGVELRETPAGPGAVKSAPAARGLVKR